MPLRAAPAARSTGHYVFPVFGLVGLQRHASARRARRQRYHHGDDIFGDARPAARRGRRRHGLLGRLEPGRRQPALAPRPAGEPVLLRAPLRLLDRSRGTARTCSAGQVIGFMGNTGDADGHADAPPLRGAPGLAALPRLRRRRRPDRLPRRVAAPEDLPFPVATGWAPKVPGHAAGAGAGRDPARDAATSPPPTASTRPRSRARSRR